MYKWWKEGWNVSIIEYNMKDDEEEKAEGRRYVDISDMKCILNQICHLWRIWLYWYVCIIFVYYCMYIAMVIDV